MTKRRMEITVETERLVLAHSRRTTRIFCARCGAEVGAAAGPADEMPDNSAPGDDRDVRQPGEDSRRP